MTVVGENPEAAVPVELDDEGLSTDVEAELSAPEDQIEEPFDPAEIDVTTRTMTVGLLLNRLSRNLLDLSADYHRGPGTWNVVNQSRLIESMLLRIPLPALYAVEVGDESWAIVDGVARLTTVARFVAPELINSRPLRLSGLEYLQQFEGSSYRELSGAMQTRIMETELIVHVIRSSTPEPVMFNILNRLNTGGRPWAAQELRNALIPGPARDLLRDLAEGEAFLRATQGTVKPSGMADREMVLRFLSFHIFIKGRRYEDIWVTDLNSFLVDGMWEINHMTSAQIDHLRSDFGRAMHAAADIYGKYAFRKIYRTHESRTPVNRALYEAESVTLAKMTDSDLAILRDRRDLVVRRLMKLMKDPEFRESISISPGMTSKIRYRFAGIDGMLNGVLAR